MTKAIVFPGQGSQYVGMDSDFAGASEQINKRLSDMDKILGRPLSKTITEGPKEDLDDTANAQPAIFTINHALWEACRETLSCEYILGHSLGELSACAAAGVFSFEDGLKIVAARSELMAKAAAARPGGMTAVIGIDEETAAAVAGSTGVAVANYNSPAQIVVAGSTEDLIESEPAFKEAGAKRTVRLPVSGPFHTAAMAPAAQEFKKVLEPVAFNDPKVPIVSNVTGSPVTVGIEMKDLLVSQIFNPVKWRGSINWLIGEGVDSFIEIGPGRVMSGIIKKISRDVKVSGPNDYLNS